MGLPFATGPALAVLSASFLLASCGGGGGSQDLSFERLAFAGWVASGSYVFRNSAEAQQALEQGWRDAPAIIYFGRERPPGAPQLPTVDYTRSMVLGVSQGQGNVCQNLIITRIVRMGADLEVEYKVDPPYFSNVCGSPPPVPWNAWVAVPATAGQVKFTLVPGT